MTNSMFIASLPLTVVATIAMVVACAPNDGRVPIEKIKPSQVTKAMDLCLAQMRGISATIENRWIPVCEVEQPDEISEIDPLEILHGPSMPVGLPEHASAVVQASGAKSYALNSRMVKYVIAEPETSGSKNLRVKVTARLEYPKEMPLLARKRTLAAIRQTCLPRIKEIWERSQINLLVDLGTPEQQEEGKDEAAGAHRLRMEVKSMGAEADSWSLVMAPWPDRGVIHTNISEEEKAKCTSRGGSKEQKDECALEVLKSVNNHFCVNFALMIGQWVGLESYEVQTKTCGTAPEPEAEASTEVEKTAAQDGSKPEPVVQGSFMKAGADRNNKGEKFWTTAKLSPTDLKMILGPKCRSFQMDKAADKVAKIVRSK